MGTGNVTLGTNLTAAVSANTLTIGGAIGDGGAGHSLIKAGAGTLVLTGANTYTGNTTINGGTLDLGTFVRAAGGGTLFLNGTNLGMDGTTAGDGAGSLLRTDRRRHVLRRQRRLHRGDLTNEKEQHLINAKNETRQANA